MSPDQAIAAAQILLKIKSLADGLLTTYPELQTASGIIGNMQAEGRELPTADERATLKAAADAADAKATAAIEAAGGSPTS